MNLEQIAREKIDKMLISAGWAIQDMQTLNPGASRGVAVREYPTDAGEADYVLFVEGKPCGVIEAKREGTILSPVEEQSQGYAKSKLKWRKDAAILPFVYESTGVETRFTDNRDLRPTARPVFHFHKPETLREWLRQETTFRNRLKNFPPLPKENLRECQFTAIQNLERSFAEGRPRALIQMATGAGKTFTAITAVYRLLKFAGAKRILFLVDTRNLGEQAEQEFRAYTPSDDKRKFTELYNVQRLSSRFIDPAAQVCISTIQRLYSILKGEDLDDAADAQSLFELQQTNAPKLVQYNPAIPIETFDVIIIDECHRSIYNLWKQVLDYFDAFLIGLTATPDSRTIGFFNENLVSEYTHEQAVADDVNVGFDVYVIETDITKNGAVIPAKEWIEARDKTTRRVRFQQTDDEIRYEASQLNRDIVNPSQIRAIIREFKRALQTEIFPQRRDEKGEYEVPKTLIFAMNDHHAEDIVRIAREEFAEGNDFCKKITYNAENPSTLLQQFRSGYYPRIAVTVDMIATGTDVKPIEVLLFMRDVKSRSYFAQMIGRGTRTLSADDLRKVTRTAKTRKTHFVIVDAVGVMRSAKLDMRPLERKRSVPMKDLMMNIVIGDDRSEDTFTSLANRLTRLSKQLTDAEQARIQELSGGNTLQTLVRNLLDAHDPDALERETRARFNLPDAQEPSAEQLATVQADLAHRAAEPFQRPDLRDYLETARRNYEQLIDTLNLDRVTQSGFSETLAQKAQKTLAAFQNFIEQNKTEITALKIFFNQPYGKRRLTFQMIKELAERLLAPPTKLTTEQVWDAYAELKPDAVKARGAKRDLVDLVALLSFHLGETSTLVPFRETIDKRFQEWAFRVQQGNAPKFTEEQMQWLRMMKDHIATSLELSIEDFDTTPFAEKGGLGKLYQLFGPNYPTLLDDLQTALAA